MTPGSSRRNLLLLAAALTLAAPALAAPPPVPDQMTMGSPTAPVTVIEYGSVACPVCAAFNNEVFGELKKKYIDTGKVRFIFREALTGNPTLASSGFLLARCAAPGDYFKVTEAIFRAQSRMYVPGTEDVGPQALPILTSIAKSVGVSEARMKACLTDPKAIAALNERVERYARQDNLVATPTFIVNGSPYEGYVPLEQFEAILRPLLASGGR